MRALDSILVKPGDIVMMEYVISGGNETMVDLAIHQAKQAIANDARFNYQGSEINTKVFSDNSELRVLDLYVQVRKTPREERVETQEAGMGVVVFVSLATLAAVIAGAFISHSHYLTHLADNTTINGILAGDQPAEVKKAALEAVKGNGGIGAGIAVAGGGLATAAIIIGVLWALSLSRGGAHHVREFD